MSPRRARSIAVALVVASAMSMIGAVPSAMAATPEAGAVVSVADVTVVEGTGGTNSVVFVLSLGSFAGVGKKVTVATSNGTATSPKDYTAVAPTVLTFSGTTGRATISVPIITDSSVEASETFRLNLSNPVGVTIPDTFAVATITDDERRTITVGNASVTEGNSGTKTLAFTLTLNKPALASTSVNVSTANLTASAPTDFTALTNVAAVFSPGAVSTTVGVVINGDTTPEATETFHLVLQPLSAFIVGDGIGVGTITNDDTSGVSVSIGDTTAGEPVTGQAAVTFPITLSGPSPTATSLTVTSSDGTATGGSDYDGPSSFTVPIALGAVSASVTVAAIGDAIVEPSETFTMTITDSGGLAAGDLSAIGTLIDSDATPVVSLGDASVTEGDSGFSNIKFVMQLDRPTSVARSVSFRTIAGTAVAGADFTQVTGAGVTIPAFASTALITVEVRGDTVSENTESFSVELLALAGLTAGDLTGTGTILDNDNGPVISVADVSVAEGTSAGSTNVTIMMTIDRPATGTESFGLKTANGTALAGSDYSSVNTTLFFPAGAIQTAFTFAITSDSVDETDEQFTVSIVSLQGLMAGDTTATITILDDDTSGGGGLRITSISNPTIVEGNSGTKSLNFTVSLSGPATGTESFKISTANGTATAGTDYVARTNVTITIPAGNTQRNVTITINGDTIDETNETLLLNIISAIGLTIDDNQATGTITDND